MTFQEVHLQMQLQEATNQADRDHLTNSEGDHIHILRGIVRTFVIRSAEKKIFKSDTN